MSPYTVILASQPGSTSIVLGGKNKINYVMVVETLDVKSRD